MRINLEEIRENEHLYKVCICCNQLNLRSRDRCWQCGNVMFEENQQLVHDRIEDTIRGEMDQRGHDLETIEMEYYDIEV